jgi:hypothetical protein
MIEQPTGFPDIDAARDAAQQVVDRLVDLTIDDDPERRHAASNLLCTFRVRITDVVRDAFARAEAARRRHRFLFVMDSVAFHRDQEALAFEKRVAREDPDRSVRRYAKDVYRYLVRPDEFDLEGDD